MTNRALKQLPARGPAFAAAAVTREIHGWGHFPVESCAVFRPERADAVAELVAHAPQPHLIARGLGRSYGDASLNRDSGVIACERLNRMAAFDPGTGVLACEAAVSLAEILEHFMPRGFFFPVTPGTKFITVGGAIAADVHGKNHHRDGSISAFLLDLHLLTASGEVLACSREHNADVFWATIGGMGLTGIILDARLQLRRVESAFMAVAYERIRHLDALLERIESSDAEFGYSVAWIDCLARGASLGRSVLMLANHSARDELPPAAQAAPHRLPRRPKLTVPCHLPNQTLNPLTMRLFNSAYYYGHREGRTVVDCDRYFYPLDAVHHWNRGYGRRGVVQYQVLLPPETSRASLIEILEELSSARRVSFLAVLKSLGRASQGLLSFPRPGHTLSLDLPITPDLMEVMHRLDARVLRAGGSVYLAKDACLRPETFAAMYPQLDLFREIKAKIDPNGRFSSSLARRVGVVEAP